MTPATRSELLTKWYAERAKMATYAEQMREDLLLPNPQITDGGVVIAEGDAARQLLKDLLSAFDAAEQIHPLLIKLANH